MNNDITFPTFLLAIIMVVGTVVSLSSWLDPALFDVEPAEVTFFPSDPSPLPDWEPPATNQSPPTVT